MTNRLLRSEARTAYLCLIPSIIGLIVLTYIPLAAVFGLSLFRWEGVGVPQWVGLKNYIRLFNRDPYFKDAIWATIYFALLAVAGSMIYSLVVALLLNRKIPARGFFRAVFYLPYVLPAMAVYIGWSWLYETNFGLLNYLLSLVGIKKVMFIGSSQLVIPSLALITVWLSGNLIVIFLAGFQNVPRIYLEAAEIDGANSWQQFWKITLRLITPNIHFNLIIQMINGFLAFTQCLIITQGKPMNSTLFYAVYMYQQSFDYNATGYGTALAWVMLVIISIMTIILFATKKMWVYDGGM